MHAKSIKPRLFLPWEFDRMVKLIPVRNSEAV
jgi:hypothetical protein